MRTIDLPADVYESMNVPEGEREEVIRRELAVSLYREDILSSGTALELSGLSRRQFHRLLGDREVDRHYGDEELAEDLDYAR